MPDNHSLGLRFKKLDLHLHTPGSTDYQDRAATPKEIVDRAIAQGLSGIAVTDHNSGEWVDRIKEAATGTDLTVFPGAEITCSGGKEGGIHVIALFDPSCSGKHIEGLLASLGLTPEQYGDLNAIVTKTPMEVVEAIARKDGLSVLAHANSSRGALKDIRGQQRIALVKSPFLHGAEATDCNSEELKKEQRRTIDYLDGTDSNYQRLLAVYQGSDSHELSAIGSRCSFFKLDTVNLEGLGQCLSDPLVRIRQDFEFQSLKFPQILGIRITGGFLDGAEATFHEGLNSILGAKGAGKSLVVEFLRFALDQASEQEDILSDHQSKLVNRLQDYSTIEVWVADETGREMLFKRTYDAAAGNPYEDGTRDDVAQLFPVLFLSQNEIIRISEDPTQQIAFIDRFFDFHAHQAAIRSLEEELKTKDGELAECFRATKESRYLEIQIRQKQTEVAKLDQALKNPVFDQYAQAELKDRALREQLDWVKNAAQRIKTKRVDIEGPQVPTPPEPFGTEPAVRRMHEYGSKARQAIAERLDAALSDVATHLANADAEYKKWQPGFREVKKKYDDAIRGAGGDYRVLAQQRAKLVKEVEALSSKLALRKQVADRAKAVAGQRAALLSEIAKAYQDYSSERRSKCERIAADSGDKLRIAIREASNIDEFKRRLRSLKKGSHLRDVEIDKICAGVSARDFMQGVVKYGVTGNPAHVDVLAKNAKLDAATMRSLAEFLASSYEYEDLLALEYTAMPEDHPEIRFDVASGQYELLENLSVGQKSIAMLIMALTEGSRPIVIDQPEDSLDLRSIWEDICKKVRAGKERRQFIFTTHNSSVAVASDTDKFIILEASATQGKVVFSGSMDHKPVSEEALKYLEGGPQTYRTKFGKYRGDKIIG